MSFTACVGNRLTQVLAHMTRDHEEGSALRGIASKHFLRLVRIRVAQSKDGFAKMGEGVLKALHRFGFVSRRGGNGLEIDPSRRLRTKGAGNTIVGGNDVGEDLPDGPHTLGRPPVVLVCRNGFREVDIPLFVEGDFLKELRPCARGGCG